MRREKYCFFAPLIIIFSLIFSTSAIAKESVVFGGGPLYAGAAANRDIIRNSGFTTVILWTIHIQSNGDLAYNDTKIVQNGVYIGKSTWGAEVHAFKEGVTSVRRIEIGIGSWLSGAFESIKNLIAAEGTGPNSTLYKNFKLLKETVPAIDGISFDDEVTYDVASSVQFAIMLSDLGYKVTLCPYNNSWYWSSVFSQTNAARPGTIDRVDLQCYAGGGGNNPGTWNNYFGGLKVTPGLWCFHYENGVATGTVPSSVQSKMTSWNNSYNIAGGFMWLLDNMLDNQGTYPVAAYAAAINNALSIDPSDNPVVSLYQHLDYDGWSAYMGLGAYTAADIVRAGGYDNDATSLQIAPGYKVTLYDGDNFQGNVLVKYADDSNLVDDGWNDKLSSMIIEAIDGPVAHWQFNENSGSSAADSSGYGFTGSLINMEQTAWGTGRQCSGLTFDGVDDHIVVNGYRGVSDGLSRTCTAWIKAEDLTGGYYNILSWGARLNGELWVFRLGSQ
ncbi:MAG: hypothetical protein JXM68_04045, partial [Sedimentisphaerales bacterium]|nr:hypothetical protein [Sedimentisphaerales bacterium]